VGASPRRTPEALSGLSGTFPVSAAVSPCMSLLLLLGLLVPAHFAPSPGWHVREGSVHACPGVSARRCSQVTTVASSTRLRDCVECLPHRTTAVMPSGAIVIKIGLAIEHPSRLARTFSWPPRITRASVAAGFEGLPGRIGVYQGSSRIGAREVSVFVLFGRGAPTKRQLRRANAELRRARVR